MRHFVALLRRVDGRIFFATLILVSLGFSAIYSINLTQEGQDFLLVKKQLIALMIGLGLALIIIWSNYRWTHGFSVVLYVLAIVLLIAVLFWGQTIRGTTGWFSLYFVHFQPVEFAKLAVVIALARYFSHYTGQGINWRRFFFSGIIVGLPIVLTLLQPDLGSALLLAIVWLMMIFFAGLKIKQAAVLVVLSAIGFLLAWQFLLVDYQKARIVSFINPASDPMGEGYNVRQAIIAVGSGGLYGRGLGFGSQSQLKFLPESQTDFIFAVIAEEFGLIGVLLLFLAFYFLLKRFFWYARSARDDYASLLFLGITSLFFSAFIINIGMNLGLLPVTGIALPLVSYGGSSLIVSLLMIGLVESIIVHSDSATRPRSQGADYKLFTS
ncbi:MAG: rod shape-determining protein RodA [Candidatus Uhrbacteria bacterium]